jgi:hypothetical protein
MDADITLPSLRLSASTYQGNYIAITLPLFTIEATMRGGVFLDAPLPSLSLEATGKNDNIASAAIILPLFELSASAKNEQFMSASLILPALQGSGNTGAISANTLPALILAATGSTGSVGRLTAKLPLLTITGTILQEQLARASLILPRLTLAGTMFTQPEGQADLVLPMLQLSASALTGYLASADLLLPSLTLSANLASGSIFNGNSVLPSLVIIASVQALPIRGLVITLERHGVTEYSNMPFTSLTKFGDLYLGVANGGIYLLEGDTDAGALITSTIRIPTTDFGTSRQKRVPQGFLGMQADGFLKATLIADDVTVGEDVLENTNPLQHGQRMKFGRGAKGRYWTLEITNVNGAAFNLDEIELFAEVLSRHV